MTGGKIRKSIDALMDASIFGYKGMGKSKEDLLSDISTGWTLGGDFKDKYTDGTDEDLQTVLNYVKSHW